MKWLVGWLCAPSLRELERRLDIQATVISQHSWLLNELEKRSYFADPDNAAPEGEAYLDRGGRPNKSRAWWRF